AFAPHSMVVFSGWATPLRLTVIMAPEISIRLICSSPCNRLRTYFPMSRAHCISDLRSVQYRLSNEGPCRPFGGRNEDIQCPYIPIVCLRTRERCPYRPEAGGADGDFVEQLQGIQGVFKAWRAGARPTPDACEHVIDDLRNMISRCCV